MDSSGNIDKQAQTNSSSGGKNLRPVVYILVVFIIYLFVLHCVWISSNAYSSPSIVLASYGQDGSRFILDDFR